MMTRSRIGADLRSVRRVQAETSAAAAADKASSGEIPPHAQMEQKLGMYCGLILYMIEMDEERYQKLCTVSSDRPPFECQCS